MKAHRTDGVSLTFALLFLGVTAWWLVAQLLDLALPALGWIVAGALILLGTLGLLGAIRAGRSSTPAPANVQPAGSNQPVTAPPANVQPAGPDQPVTAPPATDLVDPLDIPGRGPDAGDNPR